MSKTSIEAFARGAVATAIASVVAALFAPPGAAAADPKPIVDELRGAALVTALRGGGYVIHFRHAATEKDYADQTTAVMGDCSTQRMLSEVGWRDARMIGAAFARLTLPVGDVVASEYCRAWQTADLAFGRYRKDAALNFEKAEKYTDAQVAAMRGRVRPLLAAMPMAGTNTMIVGHDDPFEAATGIYPEPQGVAHILLPDGKGGFAIRAQLKAADWAALLR
jgi:phosphohistidine phosphatase SixA